MLAIFLLNLAWFRSRNSPGVPTATLERFTPKGSPVGAVSMHNPRQSMSSSVENSVRRDAKAVIAAISTACTASAR
jgi:DNA-binding IclR family transcriptional regulator